MAKKVSIKTIKKASSVSAAVNKIKDPKVRAHCKLLLKVFQEATKTKARLWGTSIVGYGEYKYHRSNGDFGSSLATGFSIGNSGPTIYIVPGFLKYANLLSKLGPHKIAKSCLYIKKFDEIDLDVLKKLIAKSLVDLKKKNEVDFK